MNQFPYWRWRTKRFETRWKRRAQQSWIISSKEMNNDVERVRKKLLNAKKETVNCQAMIINLMKSEEVDDRRRRFFGNEQRRATQNWSYQRRCVVDYIWHGKSSHRTRWLREFFCCYVIFLTKPDDKVHRVCRIMQESDDDYEREIQVSVGDSWTWWSCDDREKIEISSEKSENGSFWCVGCWWQP